jgi:hypothetical protein
MRQGREAGMWELLELLLSWPLSSQKTQRQREEAAKRFGEPLERVRWLIYGVIACGILLLVVALAAVWLAS